MTKIKKERTNKQMKKNWKDKKKKNRSDQVYGMECKTMQTHAGKQNAQSNSTTFDDI